MLSRLHQGRAFSAGTVGSGASQIPGIACCNATVLKPATQSRIKTLFCDPVIEREALGIQYRPPFVAARALEELPGIAPLAQMRTRRIFASFVLHGAKSRRAY